MRILAGDIGGTNTRLMIWSNESGALRPLGEPIKFKNEQYKSLDAILQSCGEQCGALTDACFGIAGPVEGRSVKLTNIAHWPTVNADEIASRLKIGEARRVNLINDMPAHAASLSSIESTSAKDLVVIRQGTVRPTGTQVIVAPGTGLGIGMLVYEANGKLHRPTPTEGGHADLAIRDEKTWQLVQSAKKATGERLITREHLISGPGLRIIYACLKNPAAPDLASAPKGEALTDPKSADPVAAQTLDVFTQLLGQMCGNCVFNYLATGGIYIAGSIAKSIQARLQGPLFKDAFASSAPPNMQALLDTIAIKLVTYEETGLLGAATYATWAADRRV